MHDPPRLRGVLYDILIFACLVSTFVMVVYFLLTGNHWFLAGAVVSGVAANRLDARVKYDR